MFRTPIYPCGLYPSPPTTWAVIPPASCHGVRRRHTPAFSFCVPSLLTKWKLEGKVKVNNAFSVHGWKHESAAYRFLVHWTISITVTVPAVMGRWVAARVLFTVAPTVSKALRSTCVTGNPIALVKISKSKWPALWRDDWGRARVTRLSHARN